MKLSEPEKANRRLHLMAVIEVEREAIAKEMVYVLRGMNQYRVTSHHIGQTMQVRTTLDFMKEKYDANVAELEERKKEN